MNQFGYSGYEAFHIPLQTTSPYYSNSTTSNGFTAVYPNPVSDVLNVEIKDEAAAGNVQALSAPATAVAQDKKFDIRLYNEQGSQLRQANAKKGGKVQFNVQNLPAGNYFIHIYDGVNAQPDKQQIIIKH